MKKIILNTQFKKLLADTLTPVSIYLKLRDKFANTILLESSDYHGTENSFSYICFAPIARFEVAQQQATIRWPDGTLEATPLTPEQPAIRVLQHFLNCFETSQAPFNFIYKGAFGYTAYDAVQYFEQIDLKQTETNQNRQIPEMLYQVYQFIIAINHFKNELYLIEHLPIGASSRLQEIEDIIHHRSLPAFRFNTLGDEQSNLKDLEFIEMVEQGRAHCRRGDVFQMVLSRAFSQRFQGDEFNVYRALRSINPSPYLFYFDYGSFKIFGSSPEAQLVVKNRIAEIHPIAGTFKRTGNDQEDSAMATKLAEDEKESAEHVMLVDLARNDLSKNGRAVKVQTFKEVQFYSHLIHLVSKVTAELDEQTSGLALFADTFPAGTLSGAPKYKAMELIDRYENQKRGFYGGAIGFVSFEGSLNHAIMIRSFLSQHNHLFYQAGAGIVNKSNPKSELEEVNNKLRALRTAIQEAEKL